MRRRRVLGAFAGASLAGCRREPPDRRLELALGRLQQGRTVVEHLGQRIELFRDGERVTARSLLCSHWGCRVEWRADLGHYRCFCHEGTFDAQGRPRSGPPTQPLRRVAVEVVADAVRVGDR